MNTLFGSQPKATFSTQPTVSPGQLGTLPDTYSSLIDLLNAVAPTAAATQGQASAALPGQLGYQAPQIPATDFYTQVAKPVTAAVTDDFLQRTMPAIEGQFGGSAGGTFGSGRAQAGQQAGTDVARTLEQTLTPAAAQYSLSTNLANQQAQQQAAQIRNQALGLAPGTAGIQTAAVDPILQLLLSLGTQPTQTTLGVSNQGSAGLVPALLGGPLGGAAGSLGGLYAANLLGLFNPATAGAVGGGYGLGA